MFWYESVGWSFEASSCKDGGPKLSFKDTGPEESWTEAVIESCVVFGCHRTDLSFVLKRRVISWASSSDKILLLQHFYFDNDNNLLSCQESEDDKICLTGSYNKMKLTIDGMR